MKYVAIAGTAGAFDDASPWEALGVSVQKAAAAVATEAVEVGGIGKEPGIILTHEGCRACLNTRGTTLWLWHGVLGGRGGASPAEIVLQDDAGRWRIFRRCAAEMTGVKTPSELLDRISSGALYEFVGGARGTGRPGRQEGTVLHMTARRRVESVGCRAGVLNPRRIRFDGCSAADGPEDDALYAAVEAAGIVDVHVDIPEADHERLRVYVGLASLWREGERKPPVPELLYGDGSPEYARAFFVLDSLEEVFRIDPFASEEEERAIAWSGESETRRWPQADICLVRDAVKVLKRVDRESLALRQRDRRPGGMEDDGGDEAVLTAPHGAVERDDTPGDDAFEEVITLLHRAAKRDGVELMEAVRRLAMPRSPVHVRWPVHPWWLDEEARTSWAEFCKQRDFCPATDGADSEEKLAEWWLYLLSKHRLPEAPRRWTVAESWKRHFRVALFRRAGAIVPEWMASGELGRSRLGAKLGGGLGLGVESYAVSRPGDGKWPQTIDW